MKVFVTGGAGYIGSVCVEELLNAGHQVVIWDNLSEGHRAAVDPRAKLIVGDLENKTDLLSAMQAFQPEAVMHFAGKALVGESMTNPSIYYRTNVTCGVNLLDCMVQANCKKIIFSSSCATYGVPERIPIDERQHQKPVNPYGHSKLIFEQILKWYEQIHGINHIALRYFNAAGASQKYGENHRKETHLIPNVIKVALGQSEFFSVYGDNYGTPDGTCIRDFIHLIDLAQAHILALSHDKSGAYNVGTGEGYSVLQVVEMVKKVTGRSIPVKVMPSRDGDPARLVAGSNRIKQEFGWEPKHSKLIEIVTSAWEWHRQNPQGYKE
jgi:UDP-glucose 4-epimerase